ncbi:hypothetical protein V5799_004709 [Amblyomma americanum]|uniref:Uncharacterized protein n=1 Tax=Amblyomma americanum TaxID=6943 RepID=A0AAQ4D5B6_AMBAM
MMNISLSCLAGLVIFAHYADCDPVKVGKISSPDQLVPYFVMKAMNSVPGLPGLFVACVFSSALRGLLKLYHLSHLFVPVLGFCITLGTGIIISILTGEKRKNKDPDLYVACIARRMTGSDEKAQEMDCLKVVQSEIKQSAVNGGGHHVSNCARN